MKKISLALLATLAYSASIMPYYSFISYKDSHKKYSNIFGVYYLKSNNYDSYEYDLEYFRQAYDDQKDYYQYDLTLKYNKFYGYDYKLSFGIHNILGFTPVTKTYTVRFNTYDKTTYSSDYSYVLFAQVLKYKLYDYNYGAGVYYSDFTNLNALQTNLKFGKTFNYKYYLEGGLNYITLSKNDDLGNDSFVDFDYKAVIYEKGYNYGIEGSIGKSAYKVANDGFVVYNLGEEFKNSFNIFYNKNLDKTRSFGIKLGYSEFDDVNVSSKSYSILLNYSVIF